jgi:hypothetical protein
MAKLNSRRPKGSPAAVMVYCSPEQKDALERAAAKLVEKIPGARLATYRFLLDAGLERARQLGIKVEG